MTTEEGLTKISINGERFWVEDLGEGRYKVRNCVLLNDFGLNDIIDINGNVLESFGRPALLQYTVNDGEDIEDVWPKVAKYFEEENKISVEGLTYGVAGATVPNTITDEEALKIATDCPIECTLLFQEKEEKEGS